jgi:poly-gamma-glutamate synthesis protein (capsule biosynthesis protein)
MLASLLLQAVRFRTARVIAAPATRWFAFVLLLGTLSAPGVASEPLRVVLTGQALLKADMREVAPQKFAAMKPLLHGRDVVFTNLEAVIDTGVGKPIKDDFLHAAPPTVLDCLRELGVNLLALSNNHIGDLGPEGVMGTIGAVQARGFSYAGAGASIAEAAQPGLLSTKHGRVALVSAASGGGKRAGPAGAGPAGMNEIRRNRERPGLHADDEARVLADIRAAAAKAEFVIFYHHDHLWGGDMQQTHPWKQQWARACIDAGAHVFVSHGAPLLHGIEVYRGRPIFYGLGGLTFHTRTEPKHYPSTVWESVVVEGEVRSGQWSRVTLRPIVLNELGEPGERYYATRGLPQPASREEADRILARIEKMSAALGTEVLYKDGVGTIELPIR